MSEALEVHVGVAIAMDLTAQVRVLDGASRPPLRPHVLGVRPRAVDNL